MTEDRSMEAIHPLLNSVLIFSSIIHELAKAEAHCNGTPWYNGNEVTAVTGVQPRYSTWALSRSINRNLQTGHVDIQKSSSGCNF